MGHNPPLAHWARGWLKIKKQDHTSVVSLAILATVISQCSAVTVRHLDHILEAPFLAHRVPSSKPDCCRCPGALTQSFDDGSVLAVLLNNQRYLHPRLLRRLVFAALVSGQTVRELPKYPRQGTGRKQKTLLVKRALGLVAAYKPVQLHRNPCFDEARSPMGLRVALSM